MQAAIWYFSDNYVLDVSDPLRPAVTAIVTDVTAQGPLVTPPPPSLTITPPPSTTGPAGGLVGPFTIASPDEDATVLATGATMFSDAAGTVPVDNPGLVADGSQLWLRSATIGNGDTRRDRVRLGALGQRVPLQRRTSWACPTPSG